MIVKKLRSGMTGAVVLSAICALIGAIGMFVVNGIMNDPLSSSDTSVDVAAIAALVAWDLLRMGGFGMFVCALISVIFELFGKASGKMYSFVMLAGSIFGLISGFMLSLSSVFKIAMGSSLMNSSSYYGSSSSTSASGSGTFITACVFGIVAAVIVFVSLGIRSYQPAPLAFPQGYPQQGYPQYPQQGYPQQYPQQGYPQQSVPVQPAAVDLTKTDNDPNNQ